MKFKVGDKVKVRDDLEVGKSYSGIYFIDSMKKYKGLECTINAAFGEICMIEEDEKGFSWGEDMLEPVGVANVTYDDVNRKITIEADAGIMTLNELKSQVYYIVPVLGTNYKLYKEVTPDQNKKIEPVDGLCDTSTKEIWIAKFEDCIEAKADLKEHEKKVIRHEIVHAFMYESGLDVNSSGCCSWANNEEMIDWFAIQSPKIFEVYKTLNLI